MNAIRCIHWISRMVFFKIPFLIRYRMDLQYVRYQSDRNYTMMSEHLSSTKAYATLLEVITL